MIRDKRDATTRPRSRRDFSGVGVQPWGHPAVTNGVRTEQQRKFPLFGLILLLFPVVWKLQLEKGPTLSGGSAPAEGPELRVHLHLPCACSGAAFPSGARRKGSSEPEGSKRSQSQQSRILMPRVSCATWHGDCSGTGDTRPSQRDQVQAGAGTEPGPPAQGLSTARKEPGSSHTSHPVLHLTPPL